MTAGTVVRAVNLFKIRTVNAVRALANLQAASFTDPSPEGITIMAVHITELRLALDEARTAIGLPADG